MIALWIVFAFNYDAAPPSGGDPSGIALVAALMAAFLIFPFWLGEQEFKKLRRNYDD